MGSGICRYRRDSVGVVRVLQGRRSGDQTFPARYRIVACQRTSGRSLHDPRRGAWICFSPVSHLGADYQCGCARRRHPACALVVTAENSLAKSSTSLPVPSRGCFADGRQRESQGAAKPHRARGSALYTPMPDCDRRPHRSGADLDGCGYRDRVRVQKSQGPVSQPRCTA